MAAGLDSAFDSDESVMRRALELAKRGLGKVEPNPPVGAVLVDSARRIVSEGWHEAFGGPHAEVNALRNAGAAARGADLFVTLEPCAHFGKTPPCTQAILDAGVRRVVVATRDPAPHSGDGLGQLRSAGVVVETGLCSQQAEQLIAPFAKLTLRGQPWVHAKWAMSLDGKLATRTGNSQWISDEESRRVAHLLRGRMDGILTGVGSVLSDDPQLTARPPGPRIAKRIVLDPLLRTPTSCNLVRTARDVPVLLCCSPLATEERRTALRNQGAEILECPLLPGREEFDLSMLLSELGSRSFTHLLVEGGGRTLGAFVDQQQVDEAHVFVAPVLLGGSGAPSPVQGLGVGEVSQGARLLSPQGGKSPPEVRSLGADQYIHGRVQFASPPTGLPASSRQTP